MKVSDIDNEIQEHATVWQESIIGFESTKFRAISELKDQIEEAVENFLKDYFKFN